MEKECSPRKLFLKRWEKFLECQSEDRYEKAYKPWTKPLSVKQQEILKEIEDVISGLDFYHDISGQEMETNDDNLQQFCTEVRDLDKCMLKAYRLRLENHPRVNYWHDVLKYLGQRKILEKAKNVGAERGVKSLLKIDRNLYDEIIKLAKEGKSWKTIRNELVKRNEFEGFPIPCSRNAFYELRQRYGIPSKSELKKMGS